MLAKLYNIEKSYIIYYVYVVRLQYKELNDQYLKLIQANIFIASNFIETYPDFNVIAHFLAQCISEPWTTTITAGAISYTPL